MRKSLTASAVAMCASLGALLGKDCSPPEGGPLTGEDLATARAAAGVVQRTPG